MKKLLIALGVLVAICFYGLILIARSEQTPAKTSDSSPQEVKQPTSDELLALVNAEREKVGVKPLKIDPNVQKSAQLKADDMVKRNYFAHNVKGTKYTLTPEMTKYVNQSCSYSSENIFWAKYDKTQTAVDWWMDSTPHKKALLDSRYESIGIGIADWHVVAHFCDED